MPLYVPQDYNVYPQRRTIEVLGFLAANRPEQYSDIKYKPTYIYFDQFEVKSDRFADYYPGLEIKDDEW